MIKGVRGQIGGLAGHQKKLPTEGYKIATL
jgi:hypothetical protein